MKKVAVNALRKAGGAFLIVHENEAEALDALPLWMTRLFTALVRCSDFRSGQGDTTYAHLLAMLTPLQPRRGPREFVPTMQAIKRAVCDLEERRILARDKAHSEAQRRLLFAVAPRYAQARPSRKLDPQTRPPVDSEKAAPRKANRDAAAETRPRNSTPSSGVNSSHIAGRELSTARADAIDVTTLVHDLKAKLGSRRGNPLKRAPEGA